MATNGRECRPHHHTMKQEHAGPHHYSVIEAAKYVRLHPRTVYDLIHDSLIDYRRKGRKKGRYYFLEIDLQNYLTSTANVRRARS